MPSDRTIRRQIGAQSSTYHSRAIDDLREEGRHAKESKVVGAGAAYPAAGGINNDAVVHAALNGPEEFGVDLTAAPVVGAPHEIEEAERIRREASICPSNAHDEVKDPRLELAAILARMTEAALKHEIAKAQYEQRRIDPAASEVDELQIRINACMAELNRRRGA
jgi:hypothetical protein